MSWETLARVIWVFVFFGILVIAACALSEYEGSALVYVLFSCLSLAVLYFGFGRGAIFFDAFIGVLLWLGFWLKFSIRVAFFGGDFSTPVGGFVRVGDAYDETLLVVSCALCALLIVRFVRQYFFFQYSNDLPSNTFLSLYRIYVAYRSWILFAFVLCVLFFGGSNLLGGFYQRGLAAKTILPFGLNGIYSWLLMFGLATCSAVILRFEFEYNRNNFWIVMIVSLFECLVSSVSLLSRGMILNAGSLMYGVASTLRRIDPRVAVARWIGVGVIFVVFFAGSVVFVNNVRMNALGHLDVEQIAESDQALRAKQWMIAYTSVLFLDRWVGIEGVMSVVGKEGLGWQLFSNAMGERFDSSATSFYDKNFVASYHSNSGDDGRHFISLPGYIAFLFYPGSYFFLFVAVAAFSAFAASLEYLTYRFAGQNLVLCALIAQVIAYRYTSFGYVPMQSYKLFGTIALTILMLYVADKLCGLFFRRNA